MTAGNSTSEMAGVAAGRAAVPAAAKRSVPRPASRQVAADVGQKRGPIPAASDPQEAADSGRWPRLWRALVIGACTLILCSCRGPAALSPHGTALVAPGQLSLPEDAYTGGPGAYQPAAAVPGPPGMEQGMPLAQQPAGPWAPPGISQPWPADEYLRDGGDAGTPAGVMADWEVRGLEMEDTIAHYDTIDGQRVVEPTNRVHIYSPRFGVVRKVVGLAAEEQHSRPADVLQSVRVAGPSTAESVAGSKQNVQVAAQIGSKQLAVFQSKQGDGALSGTNKAKGYDNGLLPREAAGPLHEARVDSTEMAFLARGAATTTAWSHNQIVQVILDNKVASAEIGSEATGHVHTVKEPLGDHRLRVRKLASTQVAEPGDEVDLTIYFDNVGTQVIGNVTVIDNLTTRLEYVPDSAACSLDAQFSTEPNEGGSLVIRCELADPLEPGTGGVIRFRCRVR